MMFHLAFVFLFVNSMLSNPRLSAAAAVEATPLNAVADSKIPTPRLDEAKCGLSGGNISERIVGGEEAQPHAWPWQAQVYCTNSINSSFCGGSLVAEDWVITAAHCLFSKGVRLSQCMVYLGKHYAADVHVVEPAGVIIETEKQIAHEQYSDSRPQTGFDIALLKLDKAVQYDNNIKPICLPFDLPELKNTSICYATGWGRDDHSRNGTLHRTLKQLQMPIHDDFGYCQLHKSEIENICAGNLDRQDDVCNGDSGGPLNCREADGKWYLRGLTSFGPEGCFSVASFTKVTAYLDWITGKMASN